jgi:hypothetical protein
MDDKTSRDQAVKLTDLVATDGLLEGFTFVGCRINGPAIVLVLDDTAIRNCDLGSPNSEALLWEVPLSRRIVVGVIGARNCTFDRCTFANIGFAGPPSLMATFRRDLA